MSREALRELAEKIVSDKRFRRRFVTNPDKALSGFDLDPEERAAAYRLRGSMRSSGKDPLDLGRSFFTILGQWI